MDEPSSVDYSSIYEIKIWIERFSSIMKQKMSIRKVFVGNWEKMLTFAGKML